jgi:hypothetical protein
MGGFSCGHNLLSILLSVHLKSNQIRVVASLEGTIYYFFLLLVHFKFNQIRGVASLDGIVYKVFYYQCILNLTR